MAKPQVTLEQATRDCVELANAGNPATPSSYDPFFTKIRAAALNTQQTLYGCGAIASAHRQALLARATVGLDDRLRFALNVAENLDIPAGTFQGVKTDDPDDYLEARMFLLIKLDPKQGARSFHNFYPEARFTGTPRERMKKIAEYHAGLDKGDPKQVVFFSLGGFFSWDEAERSTFWVSTCATFARACLVASGFRPATPWPTPPQSGLGVFQLLAVNGRPPQYVPYSSNPSQLPQKGDIYHVVNDGQTNDHVGVLTRDVVERAFAVE
jgi:hypothetical protein